jgi:hypothetical protein
MIRLKVQVPSLSLIAKPQIRVYKSRGKTAWYKVTTNSGRVLHAGQRSHIQRIVKRFGLECPTL